MVARQNQISVIDRVAGRWKGADCSNTSLVRYTSALRSGRPRRPRRACAARPCWSCRPCRPRGARRARIAKTANRPSGPRVTLGARGASDVRLRPSGACGACGASDVRRRTRRPSRACGACGAGGPDVLQKLAKQRLLGNPILNDNGCVSSRRRIRKRKLRDLARDEVRRNHGVVCHGTKYPSPSSLMIKISSS